MPVSPESLEVVFDRNRLNFSWLIRLRWSSIAGQTATILTVYYLIGVDLPLPELFAIVAAQAASNLGCALWFRSHPRVLEWHLAAVMAVDVALLTGLLYFTGGPTNPFSFLYLVQIALAAVVLHAHWTWMLVALSFGGFGLLLIGHQELPLREPSVHQKGMWVALGVAAAFIVHFLLRITTALAERERELGEARGRAARQEKLASLATMAAGAAHELATPLGTVALVAKELEHQLRGVGSEATLEDIRLIREQVGRCRVILDQMAVSAGTSAGEAFESVSVRELLKSAMRGIRDAPQVRLDVPEDAAVTMIDVPPRALAQALRSVITNAQDASSFDRDVIIAARRVHGAMEIEVRDRGRGMSGEILARLGEPFFTTKEPGHGMGLGLFLTHAVLEKLGGKLSIDSELGRGTTVGVCVPTRGEPTREVY